MQWNLRIKKVEDTLEPDDYETASEIRSLKDVQLACVGVGDDDPSSVALTILRRAFGNLEMFFEIFHAEIGDDIDPSLTWGLLAVSIKASLRHYGMWFNS